MLYWDEELQEWVEDDSAESQQSGLEEPVAIPSRPPDVPYTPVSSRYQMRPVGPLEGTLDDKYKAIQMARAELAAKANKYNNAPQLLGDDTYDKTPITTAEAIGYGDRIITRKAGEDSFTTLGGNVPMPDYFKSGGYKSKPDDPHGDSDIVYYPNEIHTKKDDGSWAVTKRGGVPKPPQEAELRTTMDVINFRKAMLPEIQKQAVEAANADWESMSQGRDLSWKALHKDNEIAKRVTYHLNEGLKDLNRHLDRRYNTLLEQEKAAMTPKTPQDYVNAALTEKLGRKPTAQESLDGLAEYNAKSAGAKSRATEGGKKDVQMGLFDPETLRIEGVKFATTGKMTAMGMGGGPYVRMAIMNAAKDYLKENNIDPANVPAMQTEYNATAQAFTSIKKSTEQVKGFENGMIKNADYALDLSKDVFRTEMIPVNEVINYFKTKTGSTDIVRFGAAIYAAAMEYEKIRTAGTGISSAELSVGAQKKAEEIMNKAMTHQQLGGVVEAMKRDAKNIMEGRRETLTTMDAEMRKLDSIFKKEKPKTEPQTSNKPRLTPQQALEILNRRRGRQ